MNNINLSKNALIESIFEYRDTIVPKNMTILEYQDQTEEPDTMLNDDQRKNWVARPDVMANREDNEKIPGLFSRKAVKVGTTTPTLIKKGEDIGDVMGNSNKKRASWKDKDSKRKSLEEIRKGTGISDLQLMPGYGYPAILYDKEVILNLKFTDQEKTEIDSNTQENSWFASDLVSLKSILKAKSPDAWEITKLSSLWVSGITIESGHDYSDMVPIYELPDKKSAQQRIPYGFYTHFYTIDDSEGSKKKIDDGVMVKVKPHNRATSRSDMILSFNRIGNTQNVVVAAKIDEENNLILMKVPVQVFKFLML